MPVYTIEHNGKQYEIDAEDENALDEAVNDIESSKADIPPPPSQRGPDFQRPEEQQPNATWEGAKGFGSAIANTPVVKYGVTPALNVAGKILDIPAALARPVVNKLADVSRQIDPINNYYKAIGRPEEASTNPIEQVIETGRQIGQGFIPEIANIVSPSFGKAGYKFTKEIINDPVRASAGRLRELSKLERNYKDIQKVSAKATKSGYNPKDILSKSDLLNDAVDNTGHINTQEAIKKFNEQIAPYEDVVSKNIQSEGKTLSSDEIESYLRKAVTDSSLEGRNLTSANNAVDETMKGLALRADPNGNIPLSNIHRAKVDAYSNINYLNPTSNKIDKVIAKGLKQAVEDNIKSIDVKNINDELAKFYSVQNYLEKLNGKKVEGGRLGKYFARTVGAIIGSKFGMLETLLGAKLGDYLKGLSMSKTFSKGGNALDFSNELKAAAR